MGGGGLPKHSDHITHTHFWLYIFNCHKRELRLALLTTDPGPIGQVVEKQTKEINWEDCCYNKHEWEGSQQSTNSVNSRTAHHNSDTYHKLFYYMRFSCAATAALWQRRLSYHCGLVSQTGPRQQWGSVSSALSSNQWSDVSSFIEMSLAEVAGQMFFSYLPVETGTILFF